MKPPLCSLSACFMSSLSALVDLWEHSASWPWRLLSVWPSGVPASDHEADHGASTYERLTPSDAEDRFRTDTVQDRLLRARMRGSERRGTVASRSRVLAC
ncbi:hypothetical protein CALCODRAFT_244043 [Calocera cornea HHB12733]|uniref:Secreted protein n=1 Tax=Calocera cornea HHB12733 TaxID=1353952 RepID=A0A165GR56_9BASI|nr:hypothetical protein CALCODRAFT_244043 [Calocera cornea HHB12733]